VLSTRDTIVFEGATLSEAKQSFRDAIDGYLEHCRKKGKVPDRPFSGNFMVRIPTDLHRRAAVTAELRGKSLNQIVIEALEQGL
jgi:predicted HicB family RNase H-like nuclease